MKDALFLSPKEIYESLTNIVNKKATASIYELLMYGVLAGMYISLGAAGALVVTSTSLDAAIAKVLAGILFSVGLMLVLIPGAELFTGNILMASGIIDKRYHFVKMFRNWIVVYLGNFIGALFIAWLFFGSGYLGDVELNNIGQNIVKIAAAKMSLGFFPALFRGILCNILVCLAVIMGLSSKTIEGKILGILFPITVFIVCGYEHCIANMFFLPLGLMGEGVLVSKFMSMFSNLVPVTIGNIIGGLIVVLFHPKSGEKMAKLMSDQTSAEKK